MREIKFRGVCVITNTFFYGSLNVCKGAVYICSLDDNTMREVSPESVGQLTGLKDCKRTAEFPDGQEIYEGDIMRFWHEFWNTGGMGEYKTSAVVFAGGRFECSGAKGDVIGNIHQNPELLEGE